jgi:alkanesulfonate monooxygenase SsuD/methylene tetrahydromethanopterin reductase-like flavin-dependent oxidoreductase (luciferase family)
MSLQFGILWPFRNPDFARVPWQELYRSHLDLAAESEALGYDYAWLSEHHFVDDGYSPSLHTIGGALAARTLRIRIGTFLLLLPLHNPVRIAEDSATLDVISGGRFELGVGLGYRRAEFDDQGIPSSERGGRMEESLEIVRRLLSGETLTFDGKHNRLREVRISPPALQRPHPPIWSGGIVQKAVDRVARMGVDYLSGGQAEQNRMYDEALRAHGRDPQDFRIAAQRAMYVAPTREQAWEIAARPLQHTARLYRDWFIEANDSPDYEPIKIEIPSVEEIVGAQSFDFFGEQAMVGTPEDVIEQLEDYLSRARLTHLVCSMALPGMSPEQIRSSMRLFAEQVIPHFRTEGGPSHGRADRTRPTRDRRAAEHLRLGDRRKGG